MQTQFWINKPKQLLLDALIKQDGDETTTTTTTQPVCPRKFVSADLKHENELTLTLNKAGFDRNNRSVFLLPYMLFTYFVNL